MDSYIEHVKLLDIIEQHSDELYNSGALKDYPELSVTTIDRPSIYAIDVETGLRELISKFKITFYEHAHLLSCSGIDIGNYMNRDVDISLESLRTSVQTENWYTLIKGFLNVWEFIFLFSIAESTFKSVVNVENTNTSDLIGKILKSNKEMINVMTSKHNMNRQFMLSLWTLYCKLRNVYSHTHGVISQENRIDLIKAASPFKCNFEKTYHKNDVLLPLVTIKTDKIFEFYKIETNKFYLISDEELNIFRNFLSEFTSSLDEL
jgi:hypothetical protein